MAWTPMAGPAWTAVAGTAAVAGNEEAVASIARRRSSDAPGTRLRIVVLPSLGGVRSGSNPSDGPSKTPPPRIPSRMNVLRRFLYLMAAVNVLVGLALAILP